MFKETDLSKVKGGEGNVSFSEQTTCMDYTQKWEEASTTTSKDSSGGIEITQDMIEQIMQDFVCDGSVCGAKCCTNILLLSDKEIARIRNYVSRNNIPLNNPYSIFSQEYIDKCPFVDPNTFKCRIYPVRGEVCKSFTCNTYLKKKPNIPNYRNKKVVDMLATFGGKDVYYPCKPDLKEQEKLFKEKKKMVYKER